MDCIDRWLEKNTVLFSPVEARMTTEVKLADPAKKEMTDQGRWDKAMIEMGWTHLVGEKEKKVYGNGKRTFETFGEYLEWCNNHDMSW